MLARHIHTPDNGNDLLFKANLGPDSAHAYWQVLLRYASSLAWQNQRPEAVSQLLQSCLKHGQGLSVLDWLMAHRAMDTPAQQSICQKALQLASPTWQVTVPVCLAIDTGMQMLQREKASPWLQKLDLAAMLGVCLGKAQQVDLWAYGSQIVPVIKAGSLAAQALRLRQADTGWQSQAELVLDKRTPAQTLIYLSTGPVPDAVWAAWNNLCLQTGSPQPWLVWLQLSDSRTTKHIDSAHCRLSASGDGAFLLKLLKAQSCLN
jgi:hypothetical protein